ncbi:hypothetical protein [Microvirga yunnanensis]|uniref:hypothetical protein n=1 Tax=Microvirga yunnanensis TaxID=2953740 RepID=UPI0021C782A8|nr:hypothetical protein [Microvirga sp. HBU65207]
MWIEMTDTSAGRLYWYFLSGQWVQVTKLTSMTRDQKIASLLGGKAEADRGETIDVTDWAEEQIPKRFCADHKQIEKLVRIATTEGVEAALELLEGTPEEDDEVHRAALRALDDADWDSE